MTAAVACGSSDQPVNTGVLPGRAKPSTQTITVTVTFPNDGVKTTTNSVHIWFIEKDGAGATCANLVGGRTDPNAGPITHLGDFVSKDFNDAISAKGIDVGTKTLVYVEAVDDNGQVEWAGCAEITKGSVTVPLVKARVYDCKQAGVRDGDPCDDGDPCMIGESCKDGSCEGGIRRSCSDLTTDCSIGQCDPDLGCVKKAYNDGAACSDGLYCTTEDKCVSGDCVGAPKNCDTDSGGCTIGSVCDESLGGQCTTGTRQPYGTTCDDGLFCTTGDQCDSFGGCTGTPMDCSSSGGCATCSETTHGCTDPAPVGNFCSDGDNCTTNDQCNSTGQCVGSSRDCSTYNSGNGCTVGICDTTFGGCTSVFALEGTSCNDGNPCTVGDHCSSGSCTYTTVATSGTTCGAPCKISGTCDGFSTTCNYSTYAPSGTACDDANPCTVSDSCSFGSCYGGTYATVGAPCTMAACPNGAACTASGQCGCK